MSKLPNFRMWMVFLSFCMSGTAFAKLPPPSPEEAAKAAATKEKAATDAAVEQAALAKAQDRVAADYIKSQKAKGITVTPTATAGSGGAEVPSAALHTRPGEKAGAYSEGVTPGSAPKATTGSKGASASTPQTKESPSR
jgi:hypothetical protein